MSQLQSKGWHNLSVLLLIIFFLFGCEKSVKEEEKTEKNDSSSSEINQSNKTVKKASEIDPTKTDISPVGEDVLSEAEMWAEYKAAKDAALEAKEKENLEDLKLALLRAASFAKKLDRPDIVAWQLNNIGYYSIQEFKKKTDYDQRMHTIETLNYGEEKKEYIAKTRKVFQEQMSLLTVAEKHLSDALEFDKKLNDKNRTEKINSNLRFIEWVQNFTIIENKLLQG